MVISTSGSGSGMTSFRFSLLVVIVIFTSGSGSGMTSFPFFTLFWYQHVNTQVKPNWTFDPFLLHQLQARKIQHGRLFYPNPPTNPSHQNEARCPQRANDTTYLSVVSRKRVTHLAEHVRSTDSLNSASFSGQMR